MDKHDVARALREFGDLLEVEGELPFKVKAYRVGADRIASITEPLEELVRDQRLEELPGIGPALADKIATLVRTGSLPQLERLRAKYPPGTVELLRVPELGPKKVGVLAAAGIDSLAGLEKALEDGSIAKVKGFGPKTADAVRAGIARMKAQGDRRPLAEVLSRAEEALAWIREGEEVRRVRIAGSIRRWCDTASRIELVADSADPEATIERLMAFGPVDRVSSHGTASCTVQLHDGLAVQLSAVPSESYAPTLHHATGAPAHLARIREIAQAKGLRLADGALVRAADGRRIPTDTEAALYAALGLPEIPPELREDEGEIEAALEGTLPRLLQVEDVRGLTHCHTTWSDGKATVLEMARAAQLLGLGYITITDHSEASHYARGLTRDRLRRQWDEIAEAQEQLPGIRILRGSEVDILADGNLDFDEEILGQLDVVIGSIHQRHGLDEDGQTRRLIRALRNPLLSWIGHPTGRLVGSRDPIPLRMDEVLETAAAEGKALEVNGSGDRLDLSSENVRRALRHGVKLVVSVDAHSVRGIDALLPAVGTARRGWATRDDVLNTLPVDRFLAALRPDRSAFATAD